MSNGWQWPPSAEDCEYLSHGIGRPDRKKYFVDELEDYAETSIWVYRGPKGLWLQWTPTAHNWVMPAHPSEVDKLMENSSMVPYPGDPQVDAHEWDDPRPGMGKSYARKIQGGPLGSDVWTGSAVEEPVQPDATPSQAQGLLLEEVHLPDLKRYDEDSGGSPWEDL